MRAGWKWGLGILRVCVLPVPAAADPSESLVGHWKLLGDCRDSSGRENHGRNHGVDLGHPDGATFPGIDQYIEVPAAESLNLGRGDFSIAVKIHTAAELDDVLGDILGKYDPASRTGVTLSILNYSGVTSGQPNWRNLLFGIDAGQQDSTWTDCGRPGNAVLVFAMAVHEGHLYAATFETGQNEAGQVYRYEGTDQWANCGQPDRCNSVTTLAVYDGHLYAGVARYNARGSALADSPNENPGGRVYRYEGGKRWTDCGQLGDADTVFALAVYDGKLYASTLYQAGKGLYRYDGEKSWTSCGNPGRRVETLAVYNGGLWPPSYAGGDCARYDPKSGWTQLGSPPDTTQTYAYMPYQGRMYAATWPKATVFEFDAPGSWLNRGRLGSELETMAMAVYNGKLYAGTLPLAEVYRYDGGTCWTSTGRLDKTPDVKYRRVWSMAVYAGRLYCGTLPSGRGYSLQAGKAVTFDRALAPGWRHIAAVKASDRLKLYVDGQCVASSTPLDPAKFDLSNGAPLKIGFGQHDYFKGKMQDLRIYGRALTESEIGVLSQDKAK